MCTFVEKTQSSMEYLLAMFARENDDDDAFSKRQHDYQRVFRPLAERQEAPYSTQKSDYYMYAK